MLSRTTRTLRLHTALRRSHLPLLHLLLHADRAIDPVSRCDSAHFSCLVSAHSSRLGFTFRSLSTRALSPEVFWTREAGIQRSRSLISRSFYVASVRNQQHDRYGSACVDSSPEGSSQSDSSAVRLLQPAHLHSPLVADDFRSLVVRRKREVAILEAALEILETAPRDKRFEDLVRKHNIELEPFKVSVTQPEKRWKNPELLSELEEAYPKPVHGDLVAKSNIESEQATTVGRTLQTGGFSNVKNGIVENDFVDLEPAELTDSQQDRRWNTTQLPSSKVDSTLFGKLSLVDFPSQPDPNFERLQKKRRRQELMKEHERNSKIESLNFGAAAKSAVGGSKPKEEFPVDPLRPNASAFLEQADKKPYRSLADRLYEEQFGRPAPPGLKRTYPKGSFYDRCMKEKERKERDAAAAAAATAVPRVASLFPLRTVSSPSPRPTESAVSVSSQRNEGSDDPIRKDVISNDANQERKPGAWKCPECTYFNLATDKYCYRCQAERGENGRGDGRDSGRRPTRERARS
ncbi:hypothetical protein M758_7G179900 [Ceratodon purpureus]|uniref:RanBP2-type domain-containing protein n=1 Tax=Ceratodon purpureus TaxID=3225 RepID=A0A8T0H7X9_CERPU|nr:hypothetical protein KC19_7G182200 [Ceratodon purpureus]KAG0611961.1 hypothetical protein M758_7G179900 [Ceratodon purpureus]